jgi:nucleotide-binding universal stress UspA family protein
MMDVTHAHRPVLVGVDGSDSALRAATWGASEAARRGVALRLVTAFGWAEEHPAGHPGSGEHYRQELHAAARARLDAAAVAVRAVAPGLEVTTDLVVGYPMGVLSAAARDAQLLVIGDRGRGGFSGLLLGSVAVAMAAHAACPVVVVRGDQPDFSATSPVVVGVDGSPVGESALAFAYDAAAARGSALVAVHAWQDAVADVPVAALVDWAVVEEEERQVLAERLAGWAEKYPDVAVQRVVVRSHAVPALVHQSEGAQLVDVGSRGRGGLAGLLLGSVSQGVLHRSHCPVAVVRPDAGPVR